MGMVCLTNSSAESCREHYLCSTTRGRSGEGRLTPRFSKLSQLTPSRLHERDGVFAGDELCAAFTCDVVPAPLEHDQDFVLKADQVVQVDEEPQEPGGEAVEPQRTQVCNGGITAEHRQIPDDENVGIAREGEVGLDLDSTDMV